jgi:hypothetical protein
MQVDSNSSRNIQHCSSSQTAQEIKSFSTARDQVLNQ